MPAHQDPKTDEEIDCMLLLLGIELYCDSAVKVWIRHSGLHPVEQWMQDNIYCRDGKYFSGWSSRREAFNDIMKYLAAHSRGEIKDEPWWTSAQS